MLKFFKLSENNTTVKKEVFAGLTTFTAMMYILVVNPAILSQAGMDPEALLAATIYSSALMTILMGVFTNLPIALAPGMGLNAFFAYTLCLGKGIPWQAALGIVFYSGILFLLFTVSGLRQKVFELIPKSIRYGLTTGIGLFITLIGLKNAGVIVSSPATLVTLGNISDPSVVVVLVGILIAGILHYKKVTASLLISMLFIFIAEFLLGKVAAPTAVVSMPPSLSASFFKLDFMYFWQNFAVCLPLVLSLFFVDLFDNMGTLLSVCSRANLTANLNRALKADAFAAMFGAVLGTSSVTSYVESAAGVEQGGRTGLTSVVVAGCFLLALFFAPLFISVPLAATTPALVMVGFFMMSEMKLVNFEDFSQAFPAFVTMIMIPLTFSIAEGLALGLTSYWILRVVRKAFA